RFGKYDNHRSRHSQQERRSQPAAASPISRLVGRLFRSPLAIVLLVWGGLFLILWVALAFAQDTGYEVNRPRITAAAGRDGCDKKTEVVEIFSAGEDPVIPSRPQSAKSPSRRGKIAGGRRARR